MKYLMLMFRAERSPSENGPSISKFKKKLKKMDFKLVLFLFWAIFSLSTAAGDDLAGDKRSLLDFLAKIHHIRDLNWRNDTLVCFNWTGIACNHDNSRVVAVHLPAIGIKGQIPPNTLGRLSSLHILSLRSNSFTGPFPSDLLNITTLTALHLQFNSFSGSLPPNFSTSTWKNLTILDLSYNDFNGSIPASISNLTDLAALNLSNNSLSGEIPHLDLPNLQLLNLSNNHLNGSIPGSLLKFPNSSFSGNDFVPVLPAVPPPLPPSIPSSPSSSPFPIPSRSRRLTESEILGIAVGGFALIFVALAVLMVIVWSGRRGGGAVSGKASKGDRSPEKAVSGNQDENNRLVFFQGCNFAFDLEDLLRASAEVLGKGTFGTAYKAVLEDATAVVVKRLKEVGAGKKEFEQHMEVVGRMKHENVTELRAYYYSKDEKLMVYDYYSQGSVSSLLHGKRREGSSFFTGKRGEDRTPLDWETRLKIAIGAARGIARIHTENSGKFVHGNIKSSNVFLNSQSFGCVSDLGLSSLLNNPIVPRVSRTAGYRAPEVVDMRRSTQASDVYSFGVLVLELLTGKSPVQITVLGDEVYPLVRWVQSVVREEWTAEVFDMELMRYPNIEEELVEMLQIGMACVVRMPEQRPKMAEVVRMIEDVRRFDTGNRPSAEAKSPESSSLTPAPAQSSAGTSSPLQ